MPTTIANWAWSLRIEITGLVADGSKASPQKEFVRNSGIRVSSLEWTANWTFAPPIGGAEGKDFPSAFFESPDITVACRGHLWRSP